MMSRLLSGFVMSAVVLTGAASPMFSGWGPSHRIFDWSSPAQKQQAEQPKQKLASNSPNRGVYDNVVFNITPPTFHDPNFNAPYYSNVAMRLVSYDGFRNTIIVQTPDKRYIQIFNVLNNGKNTVPLNGLLRLVQDQTAKGYRRALPVSDEDVDLNTGKLKPTPAERVHDPKRW